MKKNIKLVIFDLDGTIINAYPAIIKSFNYTMQRLGLPKRSNSTIIKSVGWGINELLQPFIKGKDLEKAIKIYRKRQEIDLRKSSRLMPGARSLLNYLLKKKYMLAVATNRPTKYSMILIRHLGIKKYFSFVLCADKLKKGKPNPEILNIITKRLPADSKETVLVGDMAIDAKAARLARIKAIIITTGSSQRKEIKREKPYLIIKKLSRIKELL